MSYEPAQPPKMPATCVSIGDYIRSNIREYGMLIALIAIMVFFQISTGGVLFRPLNLTNLVLQNRSSSSWRSACCW